jgi:hypothetical protein
MSAYTPQQLQTIRRAVAAAREAMHGQQRYTPLSFAVTYVNHDGVQIPGGTDDERRREHLGRQLLESLQQNKSHADDPNLERELRRAHSEARWADAARSEKIVGFRLQLHGEAAQRAECLALLGGDHGLGTAIFRKVEVVIMPPSCIEWEFIPVSEDEVEQ